jgi:hypothetical protein
MAKIWVISQLVGVDLRTYRENGREHQKYISTVLTDTRMSDGLDAA